MYTYDTKHNLTVTSLSLLSLSQDARWQTAPNCLSGQTDSSPVGSQDIALHRVIRHPQSTSPEPLPSPPSLVLFHSSLCISLSPPFLIYISHCFCSPLAPTLTTGSVTLLGILSRSLIFQFSHFPSLQARSEYGRWLCFQWQEDLTLINPFIYKAFEDDTHPRY